MFRFAVLAAVFAVFTVFAVAAPGAEDAQGAREVHAGSISVANAWTRPTAAGMPMGVAYFVVRNAGATADAIVSASTPAAARVEFHRTTLSEGMARMRPLHEIVVPANGTVAVEPGGIHLMLVDLHGPLVAGTRVPLVLAFRGAGRVELELAVEPRGD
jgi:copper(I)-binding protein